MEFGISLSDYMWNKNCHNWITTTDSVINDTVIFDLFMNKNI